MFRKIVILYTSQWTRLPEWTIGFDCTDYGRAVHWLSGQQSFLYYSAIFIHKERNKLFLCKFSKLQYYHVLLKLVNIWVEWVIRKVKGWTFLRYSVHSPFTGSFKSNHWCCLQFPIIHDEHWQTTVNTKCSYKPQSTLYFYTVHTHSLQQYTVSQGQKVGPL